MTDGELNTFQTTENTMTRIQGKLTSDLFAQVGPIHVPSYVPRETVNFSDVDMLTFRYVTDAASVSKILPSSLELDENPIANILFISYGLSGVGAYREFVQQVSCRFRGKKVHFTTHIYVDNEPAMLSGREWLGWPKQLGKIGLDVLKRTQDGLVHASLHRPEELLLASALFRPGLRLPDVPENASGVPNFNVRIIPSAIPGKPPVVSELVCTTLTTTSGQVWSGEGSLHLTGASDFSPLHRVPVVNLLDTTLVHDATITLTCPTETFPI